MKEDEKKIAPLDALFPTIRVPPDDVETAKKTLVEKNIRTAQNAKSKPASNTWAIKIPDKFEDMKEDMKIVSLDALFPKIRVPSNDVNMHESTQEDEKNPAVTAAKMTLYAESKLAFNMRALTLKTYREDGSRAETVMTMTLHHPTDRQDQTTSPALTTMREQVDNEDQI